MRRLREVQQASDALLGTVDDSAAFSQSLAQFDATPAPEPQALGNLIKTARTLMTSVGNQSNLILDPDLDSYYSMSLVVLRFPELVEVLNDTTQAIRVKALVAGNKSTQSTALLIVAGRLDAVSQGIRADYKQAYAAGGANLQAASDMALAAPASTGRMFTLTPWRGRAMVGTYQADALVQPHESAVTASEVDTFITQANEAFPALKLTRDDVTLVHRGVVPAAAGRSAMAASRIDPRS